MSDESAEARIRELEAERDRLLSELDRMRLLYEWDPPAEDVRDVVARLRADLAEAREALRVIANGTNVTDVHIARAALSHQGEPTRYKSDESFLASLEEEQG